MQRSRGQHSDAVALYDEIKGLTQQLSNNEKRITKRRETAEKLVNILSKEKNRNKLNEMAISNAIKKGLSPAKAKRWALSVVWSPIINTAFASANTIANGKGKNKIYADDVKLPLRLLHYSDTSAEGHQVRLESSCKLSERHVKTILKFCIDMYFNDEARKEAELELLKTLTFLCERVDYVAFFSAETEMLSIMRIVEDAMALEEERDVASDSAVAASKIFGALLESAFELGIGLHLFVSESVELVSRWCEKQLEDYKRSPREASHLFRGVTALLRFHPEQAIKPLTRYGGPILRYAKRSYSHSAPVNRHAIDGYLIAHIIVSQQAGILRGLMPGELGLLGEATLTEHQIKTMLAMVLSALTATQLLMTAKNRVSWNTLDTSLRRHLELCARLLACAQRQFLVSQEWKLLDDPNDFLTKMVRELSQDEDEVKRLPSDTTYPSVPPPILAKSPWATHVLAPLIHNFAENRANEAGGSADQATEPRSQDSSSQETTPQQHTFPSKHPLVDCISALEGDKSAQASKNSRLLLLVIAACAEAFPSGRCFASTSHKHWSTLDANEIEVDDIAHINMCSPSDFALLVDVVANVLKAAGNGDAELQMLALLCLIRLTEAHRVIISLIQHSHLTEEVATSWRKVWSIIFATEMRYSASTAQATEGSCGELVLVLITEMIRGWCTDPTAIGSSLASMTRSTFLYRNQAQIWRLPAFGKGNSLRTKQSFELACVFLQRLCLSDESKDNIPDSLPSSIDDLALDNNIQGLYGRRFRLVCLCLQVLETFNPVSPDSKQKELIAVVTACVSALANGSGNNICTTFESESRNLTWVRSSNTENLRNRFCFTELPVATEYLGATRASLDLPSPLFTILWATPTLDPGMSSLQKSRLQESIRADSVLSEKSKLDQRAWTLEAPSPHIDYVSASMSSVFRSLLRSQFTGLLERWSASYEKTDEADMDLDNQPPPEDPAFSIPAHCLWLKVSLSLCVPLGDDDNASVDLEWLENDFVTILERIKSGLSNGLCEKREEFYDVFEYMLQIVNFLSELSATVSSFVMPPTLGKKILVFDKDCDSLLRSFSGEEQSEKKSSWDDNGGESEDPSSESDSGEMKKASVTDLLDDSDDDDVVNTRTVTKHQAHANKKSNKRKARPSYKAKSNSPRKKRKRHPCPPDSFCASLVGAILVTLNPSVEVCEHVVGCLLPTEKDGEVDLAQAYHCLNLLADASVLLHDNAKRQIIESADANDESFTHRSPISVFCDVFDSFRASAPSASSLHMFGFQLCADCVRLGESDERGTILNADESNDLVERLTDESDSLKRRPYLRCDQLRAATFAFSVGKDAFHKCMDGVFPKEFVIPSIRDLSSNVRTYSRGAVAEALRILSDTNKVVQAVQNLLPPVALPSETGEKSKVYQQWYQNFDLGSADTDFESRVWQDAKLSMEVGTIDSLAIVAGVMAGDIARDIVYDFVKFSAKRPELEAACFRACGKIASMMGYSSADAFLSDQGELLLGRWLESGETIAEIPLLLSAPKLLGLLLRTGQQTRTYLRRKKAGGDSDNDQTKPFDVVNLRDVATDQFVARHRTYILPQMLLRICRSEPNDNGPDAKSRIINDRLIQEFCVCLKGNHDDATIKALVQGRLHDIEALCAPMAHSDLSDLGKKILELVFNYLRESEGTAAPKVSSDKPHLTIRRMLELSGIETAQIFPALVVKEAFSEAISAFISNKKPTKEGDILSATGTSLTESFLYARHWLSKATLPIQKEKRWGTLSLLFDLMLAQIRQKRFKQTQLSVGVNIAVDIVLDHKLRCIHSEALAILRQVLKEVIGIANVADAEELKKEFSSVCRRMVGSLMKKHEESQKELLQICKTRAKKKLSLLQKSLGLLGGSVSQDGEDGDVWGWDADVKKRQAEFPDFLKIELKDFQYDKNRVLVDSITGTYDLLVQIFDNAEVLGLGLECFVGCMPPFATPRGDQTSLSKMNPRFAVQKIASDFLRRKETKRDTEDLSQSILFALNELKNRASWMDEFADQPESSKISGGWGNDTRATGMTIAQWMLNAELKQLESKLRRHRLNRGNNLLGVATYKLIKELSFVCGASCPHELQTAASKCLGELDVRQLDKVLLDEPQKEADWVSEALEADSVLRGAQANAIGVLAGYLHSEHSGVAIAALDTIIALLTTVDGIDSWALVNAKAKQDLAPVLSKKKRPVNMSRMQLSKLQVDSIKMKTSVGLVHLEMPGDTDNEWCWSENLWRCKSDPKNSYESWICDLVPALIECCYRGVDPKRPSSSFFSCCMALAAIAPKFAEAIFPAIVIDLLDENDSDAVSPLSSSRSGNVFEDTWIGRADSSANRRLSHCFRILLVQDNALAVALALDTIELLRRATQSRFQKSENHKRNSNALPPSSTKKASKGSRTARRNSRDDSVTDEPAGKGEYNKGLGIMTPWKGVPYGSVLKLSGPMVVQACINSKRYASALFYSELYFESCFAGSGAIMEKLASNFAEGSSRAMFFSRIDISGYYMDGKPCETSEVRERAIASLKLLEDCFLQLHEEDSHQAVVRQSTDLQYSTSDSLMIDNGELGHVFAPTLDDLQRLDSTSNLLRNPVALSIQTADTMEALGLRNLLQRYIGSMERSTTDAIPPDERQRLREKWFESRLYGMEWNEALLDCGDTNVTDGILSGGRVGTDNSILAGMPNGRDDSGFHEAIMNALSDFARDDLKSCDGLLKVARTCLLQPVSTMATAESSMHGLSNLIERLQYLSDIESLVNGDDSPDTLLKRWGFSLLSENDDALSLYSKLQLKPSFDSAEFTPHMREAVLRFLRFNKSTNRAAPEHFDPQQLLIEHLGTFSRWCRTTKHLDVAEASLQRLRGVLQAESTFSSEDASLRMVLGQRLEEASLCESRGDFTTAIRLSKQAISLLNGEKKKQQPSGLSGIDCLLVDSLINCGNWLSKNKIEPARTILDSYHLPGTRLALALYKESGYSLENGQRYLRAQLALARLASGLYDSISARVKSLEWIRAGRSLAEREQELRHCESMMKEFAAKDRRGGQGSAARSRSAEEQTELAHYSRQLKTEINLAKRERVKTEAYFSTQLHLAVSSFAEALAVSGVKQESDMSRHVFRMVYLWLHHCSEGNEHKEVNSTIHKAIARIPSFRFVPLTSQLFAQIDQRDLGPFQVTLHKLVEKMCKEHPYHCLVQLISVCNGKEVGGGVSGRNANFFLENMSSSKVDAAASIAARLRGTSFVGELLENYETLMGAYIQLANAPTAKLVEQGKIKNISMSQACKSNRLDRCLARATCPPCILTKPPPVRSGCDYGDGKEDPIGAERIQGFDSTFAITDSGLHRPKIVMSLGSQGGRYRQLVKGEDEIRQDAVMEQVFTYVNELMRRRGVEDDETTNSPAQRKRNSMNTSRELRMVTYNIIPLSPASGVLEWVENSMTFGDYIMDKSSKNKNSRLGTHSRYYPGEWGYSRCRQHYNMSPQEERRETYDVVCKSSSPSFRFFFVERWGHSLKDWYAAKMKFTRSVAVSSIVGHILGIGDRHTNNILVSQITGEVVHIDFGIVFEQGKLLNVPEVVPFRLTRNVVDGMGPTGTEGTFARSAEATAVVLRENANALLTILSAIASDPLYRWSVSPVEARRRQRLADDDHQQQPTPTKERNKEGPGMSHTESKSDRNEAAALVLAKIGEKLQGYEDGTSGEQQSIEGQVQLLINSARDPDNLCEMFAGWAPWI